MRKVIRHRIDGTYLSSGKWVRDWHLAQQFNEYAEAQRYAQEHHLKDVEYRFIYGEKPSEKYDWAVRLSEG